MYHFRLVHESLLIYTNQHLTKPSWFNYIHKWYIYMHQGGYNKRPCRHICNVTMVYSVQVTWLAVQYVEMPTKPIVAKKVTCMLRKITCS